MVDIACEQDMRGIFCQRKTVFIIDTGHMLCESLAGLLYRKYIKCCPYPSSMLASLLP